MAPSTWAKTAGRRCESRRAFSRGKRLPHVCASRIALPSSANSAMSRVPRHPGWGRLRVMPRSAPALA
eukprot:2321260-Alexandrium_andersonii.AAC.1